LSPNNFFCLIRSINFPAPCTLPPGAAEPLVPPLATPLPESQYPSYMTLRSVFSPRSLRYRGFEITELLRVDVSPTSNPRFGGKAVHRIKFVTQTFKRNRGRSRMWGKGSVYVLKKRVECFSLYHVLYFFIPRICLCNLLSEEHE